jgi:hypothetical protein
VPPHKPKSFVTCTERWLHASSTRVGAGASTVIYLVDTTEVPDFNTMYELYDPCTCMFFFRNKHIMVRP